MAPEGTAWQEVGSRLREAREVRALNQADLGQALGVDRTALVKIERGDRRMTALELLRAAQTLGVPMDWLAGGEHLAMVSRRRTDADSTPRAPVFDMDMALHAAWQEVDLLTRDGHLRPAALPAGLGMDTRDAAEAAAAAVRHHLDLGDAPLPGMADIAARLGLHVQVVDCDVDGASMTPTPGLGAAVIGGRAPAGRRRFTCAHEIGHHVLGDEYSPAGSVGDSRDDREHRIDAFAAALLLPPSVRTATTREEMIDLAGRYRVSWTLAVTACGRPSVGDGPTLAEFIQAGMDVPEDLITGHRSLLWRQAVLAARQDHDITDAAALAMLGEPAMTLDDLPLIEDTTW